MKIIILNYAVIYLVLGGLHELQVTVFGFDTKSL